MGQDTITGTKQTGTEVPREIVAGGRRQPVRRVKYDVLSS